MNRYKALFEGRFKKTHKNNFNLFEKIYYYLSPSTYTERNLFKEVSKYARNNKLKILDAGCGGGHFELTKYGQVYGVDISTSSIKNASQIYYKAIEADLSKKFPFKDNFFDIFFCSEVFGHISSNDKNNFLSEANRVTKKDGLIIFSIETLGDNWLVKTLKMFGEYKKYWVDYQGHIGLETPNSTVKRLGKYLHIQKVIPTSKHILPLDGYAIFADRFPILKLLQYSLVRRIGNILLFLPFRFSLLYKSLDSSNDLVVVAFRK